MDMIVIMIVCACSAFVAGAGFGVGFGFMFGKNQQTMNYLSDHTERMRGKVQ